MYSAVKVKQTSCLCDISTRECNDESWNTNEDGIIVNEPKFT